MSRESSARLVSRPRPRPATEVPRDFPHGYARVTRGWSAAELEAVARHVDRIAEPLAAYLLAWLFAHKGGPRW